MRGYEGEIILNQLIAGEPNEEVKTGNQILALLVGVDQLEHGEKA